MLKCTEDCEEYDGLFWLTRWIKGLQSLFPRFVAPPPIAPAVAVRIHQPREKSSVLSTTKANFSKRLFLIPTIYLSTVYKPTSQSLGNYCQLKIRKIFEKSNLLQISRNMLYFWLTSAVHQANRASMESLELSLTKRKYKGKGKKSRKKYQSESDLSSERSASLSNDQQQQTFVEQSPTIRKASMTTASNSSLSSVV